MEQIKIDILKEHLPYELDMFDEATEYTNSQEFADAFEVRTRGPGLPPEKWSSLMYGLWPDGGLKNGKEATHCGRDRHEAAAG